MKILVTGARGLLGTDLVPLLQADGHEVLATDIDELDITETDQVVAFISREKPEVVINCAAYTQVDKAEEEQDKALAVNWLGVQNLALACSFQEIKICHLSTDYVFNGEKDAPYTPFDFPQPINVYGWSKWLGEECLIRISTRYFLVRTSWLYGRGGLNFVDTILNKAKNHPEIKVVTDQRGSPTWSVNLARFLSYLVRSEKYGLYHVTDKTKGGVSWFELAQEVVRLAGLATKIIPVTSEEFPRPARRPKNSVLDLSWTEIAFNYPFPDWREALQTYLKTKGILK
ncbi:MAG: dTDP-4-dehydrorhamnose reductase [Candidatus Aminicenantes bacterium]|nr:dTDP-4-dehydrorhamnose reductase [Candidatus Aminicenantes bacterium]